MVHRTETYETEEQQNNIIANTTAKHVFNQKLVRVVRTITLKPLSETSILAATNASVIVQIDAFTQFEQSYPCNNRHGVM